MPARQKGPEPFVLLHLLQNLLQNLLQRRRKVTETQSKSSRGSEEGRACCFAATGRTGAGARGWASHGLHCRAPGDAQCGWRRRRFPGRCCINIPPALRYSRPTSTIRQVPSCIAPARKVSISQNYEAVRGIVGRLSTQQIMAAAGNDGASKASYSGSAHGGHTRPRGRGRFESHGEERSVRAQSSRDDYRYWLNARNKPPKHHERFVLVSYNILADVNAWTHYKELYWHIQRYILDWDARKRKILRELGLWSSDIICLQEVDHYEDLNEGLEKEGYVGVYTGRTGATRDGCAMFWRKNRFELLEEESIKFKDHNLKDNVAQLCVLQTKSKTLGRNDTEDLDAKNGTEPTTSGSCDSKNNLVVVGNIHVLFNPKRGDVKLGQARILMEKAHALSEKWGKVPVAIAGDFNSTPGSALYQFISSSQLDLAGHDRRNISGQEEEGANGGFKRGRTGTTSGSSHGAEAEAEEELALNAESSIVFERTIASRESTVSTIGEAKLATEIVHQKITRVSVERVSMPKRVRGWDPFELMAATGGRHLSVVQHKMNLRSAYSEIEGKPGSRDERGEPLITTFHKKFGGTVDYIWHTDDLVTVKVLDILPISVLQDYKGRPKVVLKDCEGLPTKKWGSDHLALACEFSFVPSKDQ